jgi:hypothetical protein
MTDLRAAAQQALKSLRGYRREIGCKQPCDAERALEQPEPEVKGCDHCNHPLYAAVKCRVCGRVTEPEQEPVANNPDPYHLSRILHELAGSASMCWEHVDRAGVFQSTQAADVVAAAIAEIRQRMKDAPLRREPLSDEELDRLWRAPMSADWEHREFARAIEAAHGIKENT